MDDSFGSIVKAIMWGRFVNDAVRKLLQFQTSASITVLIITYLSILTPAEVVTTVQVLWINITMNTFATLALATDHVSRSLLDKRPDTRGTQLLTADMVKMILSQSTCQVVILLILHFLSHGILGLDHTEEGNRIVRTVVFNTFAFAQIFNSLNCRRLDNKVNIFEGILRNGCFIVITLIGTSRALLRYKTLELMMICRNCSSGPHHVCRWPRLPGHSHPRSRVGHLTCSWLRSHSSRCFHPMHSHSTTRARLHQAEDHER